MESVTLQDAGHGHAFAHSISRCELSCHGTLRENTAVTLRWVSERLGMGHHTDPCEPAFGLKITIGEVSQRLSIPIEWI